MVGDLNDWLNNIGDGLHLSMSESPERSSEPIQPEVGQHQHDEDKVAPMVPSTGTEKVWTDERKAEARTYRAKHGLKKTAEHYGVSQTTISKHIPVGKQRAKKATPFDGLGGK